MQYYYTDFDFNLLYCYRVQEMFQRQGIQRGVSAALYNPKFLCDTRKSPNNKFLKLMPVTNDTTNVTI